MSPERSVWSALWMRLVALCLGFVAAILLIEAGLQAAAWGMRAVRDEPPGEFATERRRILCVGDSNTYGLYLEREDAYPQQLQRIWDDAWAASHGPIEVVNLGVPGTNSSVLLRSFGGLLDELRPDVAIVLVGVNDFWTTPVDFQSAATGMGGVARFLDRHSRVFKLGYMLFRGTRNPAPEVILDPERVSKIVSRDVIRVGEREFELGFELAETPPRGDHVKRDLKRNLVAISQAADARDVKALFLTYASASNLYGVASALLRDAAAEAGAPLLELRPLLAEPCPKDGCAALYFPDGHPRPAGYEIIAEAVAQRLAAGID